MLQKISNITANIREAFRSQSNNPDYKRKHIFGTEMEYGSLNFSLPHFGFIDNGGKVYADMGHPEYASPETSNPKDTVLYSKAGDVLMHEYTEDMRINSEHSKIYKNVRDSEDESFECHENYFVRFSSRSKTALELIPFLITRQIFTGAGHLYESGTFDISQKSQHINCVSTRDTTHAKGLINTKEEPHSTLVGWHRLHLTFGDANMCEVAEYLKIGTTSLIIDLIEDSKIPKSLFGEYGLEYAVQDFHAISMQPNKDWGLALGMRAVDVQREYFDLAAKHYSGRDTITEDILKRWNYALDALEKNPEDLFGVVDWITKKILLEQCSENGITESNMINFRSPNTKMHNINLQYHDVDPEKGLFYALQKQGLTQRLFSDEEIQNAKNTPPQDTRAKYRAALFKCVDDNLGYTWNLDSSWSGINILRHRNQIFPHNPEFRRLKRRKKLVTHIPNPFDTYEDELKELIRKD